MLPDPIHPAIVHFPIVLSALLPVVVAAALFLARRGTPVRTTWLAVVGATALLVGSTWLAVETGEDQEEKVEDVVGEGPMGKHAGRADKFFWLAGGTLILTAAGLAKGRLGQAGRVAGTVGALALLPAGLLVGHSGGELVYKYGAARAYVSTADGKAGKPAQAGETSREQGGGKDDRE